MARTILALVLVCIVAGMAPAKDRVATGDGAGSGRQGGESWGDALAITVMPYTDSGATCNNHWDVDLSCGYTYGISPDVFYSYCASTDGSLSVSLCGSAYDTQLAIFNSGHGELVCNDDFCGLQSEIDGVPVSAGQSYFIDVSGFYGSCGSYYLSASGPAPCGTHPTGACCVGTACTVVEQSACAGTYMGDGTTCSPSPCVTPTVPTSWSHVKSLYQ